MKLYATTTSERASKGQGGQKYILVELTAEREKMVEIRFAPDAFNEGEYLLQVKDATGSLLYGQLFEPKGKKQKGELCTDGNPHRYNAEGDCTGEDCYKSKGEKQKGERHISYDEKATGKSFIQRMEERNN